MKTKSRGNIIAQLERIRKIFYTLPDWHKEPRISRMVLAEEICNRYNNINDYLGDYDVQNDETEFHRRYDLQIPVSIYAK